MFVDGLSPDRALPFVATRDIAAVAARLLLDPTWSGQEEIPLLGPEDLSPDAMAAVVSDVLGTPVRYRRVPGQALKDQAMGFGLSEAMAQSLLDMTIAKDNGLDGGVVRTPRTRSTRPPRSGSGARTPCARQCEPPDGSDGADAFRLSGCTRRSG